MIKKLVGSRVSLAPMTAEYAELMATWFNDLEVGVPLGDEAYEGVTAHHLRTWLDESKHDFMILAHDPDGDRPIGRCLLANVNLVDRNAMLGICVGEKSYWNRGLGGEAIELLLEYAFNLLNLQSVMLGTYEFNVRALACYRRLGFREIGRRRQSRLIAGTYYDSILMDMLAEEFQGHLVRDVVDAMGRESAGTVKPDR